MRGIGRASLSASKKVSGRRVCQPPCYQGKLKMSNKVSSSERKVVDVRHPSWCRHPRRQVGRHSFNQPRAADGSVRLRGTDMRIMPARLHWRARAAIGEYFVARQLSTFCACALRLFHTPTYRFTLSVCSSAFRRCCTAERRKNFSIHLKVQTTSTAIHKFVTPSAPAGLPNPAARICQSKPSEGVRTYKVLY